MTSPLIHVRGLRKVYGSAVAVDLLDLDVHAGEIVGLLGPNGAGKSTTLETICTLRRPTAGEVRVAGVDVTVDPAAVRARIGTVLQSAALDPVMTGREALRLQARLRGLAGDAARVAAERALESLEIADRGDARIATLSGGQRRRVDLAAAVVGGADVLVLDEPTTGLDPVSRRGLWAHLRRLADGGAAILLSTQDLQEAEVLADRLVVLREGRAVASAPMAELTASVGTASLVLDLAATADGERAVVVAAERGLHAAVDPTGESDDDAAPVRVRVRLGASVDGAAGYLAALGVAGVEIARFALDSPSLDDVYLHLTTGPDASGTGSARTDTAPIDTAPIDTTPTHTTPTHTAPIDTALVETR